MMLYFTKLNRFITLIILIITYNVIHSTDDSSVFKLSDNCKANQALCNVNDLEYLAISKLHDQIDDDKNGDIDIAESKDFVKESFSGSQGTEKAKKFHKTDAHIDKQDLWQIWKSSEVYNWTTAELIDWLRIDVELPQYAPIFESLKLNGSSLSRLTGIDFLTNVVNIQNSIHRKKIMIKAVDAVLFGSLKKYHITSTSIVVSLLFFTSIIAYLFIQNMYSKRFLKTMQTKLKDLSETEESLTDLRNKLKIVEDIKNQKDNEIQKMAERHKFEINKALSSSRESLYDESDKSKYHIEIVRLRTALSEAQLQINQLIRKSASLPLNKESAGDSHQLHLFLQLTHAIELQYLSERITQIDHQSLEFMELNEKIKRRKAGFLGTLRVIHSADMDEIEKGFGATKRAYEKVILEKKELEYRWNQIENITGFNLTKVTDIANVRQMINTHMESVEHQRKEYASNPLFNTSNESTNESLINHSISDPHGSIKSEKLFKTSDNSIQFSLDSPDQYGSLNSENRLDKESSIHQSTGEINDNSNITKRSRKDHFDKRKNIFKIGRTRIPSLTRSTDKI